MVTKPNQLPFVRGAIGYWKLNTEHCIRIVYGVYQVWQVPMNIRCGCENGQPLGRKLP